MLDPEDIELADMLPRLPIRWIAETLLLPDPTIGNRWRLFAFASLFSYWHLESRQLSPDQLNSLLPLLAHAIHLTSVFSYAELVYRFYHFRDLLDEAVSFLTPNSASWQRLARLHSDCHAYERRWRSRVESRDQEEIALSPCSYLTKTERLALLAVLHALHQATGVVDLSRKETTLMFRRHQACSSLEDLAWRASKQAGVQDERLTVLLHGDGQVAEYVNFCITLRLLLDRCLCSSCSKIVMAFLLPSCLLVVPNM